MSFLKFFKETLFDKNKVVSHPEQISLKFAKDGIKYNTLNDLLFKNENENNLIREAKNHEIYNVNFANTERMRKSTIIYLQNLLNKETLNKK